MTRRRWTKTEAYGRLTSGFWMVIANLATVHVVCAQHCGGPCEVPRPAAPPQSINSRLSLEPGLDRANWAYLNDFIWTVDGEPRHQLRESLSAPQMMAFGRRFIFVSPGGNGFLVTGNPYTERSVPARRIGMGYDAPLFVFCDERGGVVTEVTVREVLRGNELQFGPCPSNCGCTDLLYTFGSDPSYSPNGLYVELQAGVSHRTISFLLVLECLVEDREELEDWLIEREWDGLDSVDQDALRMRIQTLAESLEDPHFVNRETAESALREIGWMARPILRRIRQETEAPDLIWRISRVEPLLGPKGGNDHERLARDLDWFCVLLDCPDEAVASAAKRRLNRLLPQCDQADIRGWISRNQGRLKWSAETNCYQADL